MMYYNNLICKLYFKDPEAEFTELPKADIR